MSGFIGSGGAFVLTPAMMSLGVPGVLGVVARPASTDVASQEIEE